MIVRLLLAAGFTVLGIGGLLLPILPGWIFFIVAALVLFPSSSFSTAALDRVEAKMPRLGKLLRRLIGNQPRRAA